MKRLAVIGHPVAHSRSPAMHTAALADLGLSDEWSYEAIDISEHGFTRLVGAMPDNGYVGANMLRQHRCPGPNRPARTVAVEASAPEEPPGRLLSWALLAEGAGAVWNRTPNGERLVADLGGVADTDPDASAFDLLVNSSAAGLGGGDGLAELPVDAGQIGSGQVVVDMVYGDGPGSLLDAATAAGAETVDGLEILVRQGARSLEIWTGLEPSLDVMRRAARGDA
jgi:shikimate dehydrogenase